uniref:Uncharacterized protein n=1 Tax=Rhizophora mucronata TaxID=61149 RepID=A0A2P2IRH3_RHIMU
MWTLAMATSQPVLSYFLLFPSYFSTSVFISGAFLLFLSRQL